MNRYGVRWLLAAAFAWSLSLAGATALHAAPIYNIVSFDANDATTSSSTTVMYDPNLVTITREGRQVDAVAQVTKLGNTLLLDRLTGKPIFPVRMRRAPASRLPGEWTAPYQPAIELPEPFARQLFTRNDVTTRSEEARTFIEQRLASGCPTRHGLDVPEDALTLRVVEVLVAHLYLERRVVELLVVA